jgi:uncharacterized membrane protein
MSRNYGREAAGEVSGTLLPIMVASGPLMGFCGFVCVVGLIVISIYGAFSAMFGTAEQLDAYMQFKSTGLLLLVLMLPSLVALPIASRLTRRHWAPPFRRTKIFGLLLALTWVVVTAVSTINGSQIWSQLAYHWDPVNGDKSLIMAQNCPVEVAKPGYDRIAHDPKSRYSLHRCQNYLSPAEVVEACWREYRTMKPIPFTVCGWKRRELTGLNWPIKDPVVIKGEPAEIFATEAQMRAVLASKGLSPL